MQDPMQDFPPETALVPAHQGPTSSSWRTGPTLAPRRARTQNHTKNQTIDASSRVISFALGFALASVFAWLASLPSGYVASEVNEAAAAAKVASVAPAGEPVVAAATPVAPPAPVAVEPPVQTIPVPAKPSAPVQAAAPRTAPVRTPPVSPVERKPAVASGYRGALVVSSTPDGAQVLVNGRAMGQTPIVLEELPVGSRAVVLRRDGYSPWSTSVRVVANQRVPIRAALKPLDQ
jgi:hypothetical protein